MIFFIVKYKDKYKSKYKDFSKMTETTFTANSIRNKIYSKTVINQPKDSKLCKCCEPLEDSRCCGAFYLCGDKIYCDNEKQCCYKCCSKNTDDKWCPVNPSEYFSSGCFLTSSGSGSEPDCLCTLFAGILLGKFALTFPFLLGSVFNLTMNCVCNTNNKNYLF